MVDYFAVEGFDGQYFSCKRYGTMTPAACAKNYDAAPVASKNNGRLEACVGCAVGAIHAGKPVTEKSMIVYRPVCLRCRKSTSSDGCRLVGRMRLVRHSTICVSCYNREREVIHGANAKGAAPKKWAGLYKPRLAYVSENKTVMEQMSTPVVDWAEALLTVVRQGKRDLLFCWAPPARLQA